MQSRWKSSTVLVVPLLLSACASAQDTLAASLAPTQTATPTLKPSASRMPTMLPSTFPSQGPTFKPTLSAQPTASNAPSNLPSISSPPSTAPSVSTEPSPAPSTVPSSSPTRADPTMGRYRQEFLVDNHTFTSFNESETDLLMNLFASYTSEFATDEELIVVNTYCTAGEQERFQTQQNETIMYTLELGYSCDYQSRSLETVDFPSRYITYVNNNLTKVSQDVQAVVPRVNETLQVIEIIPDPPPPSLVPSSIPTTIPSTVPSLAPSIVPTDDKASEAPSAAPSLVPIETSGPWEVGVIAGVVVGLGIVAMAGMVFYYHTQKKNHQRIVETSEQPRDEDQASLTNETVLFSPDNSLVSTITSWPADEPSGSADNGTLKNVPDELDEYRDETLETFRSDVEDNLTGYQETISAAVTRALIFPVDNGHVDQKELLWGCKPGASGAEIEASALCEVHDWIKRNETATVEKKSAFMSDILNRMVNSVRYCRMGADDAARTIHESAQLLGLPLVKELPMTTVLISGMRKTVQAAEMMQVLGEFGVIDVAAVASGKRGFGIVRFKSTRSVDKVMRRYRGGEIVISEVAVQIKVLRPNSTVEN